MICWVKFLFLTNNTQLFEIIKKYKNPFDQMDNKGALLIKLMKI
jgi:hypothetical protein